MDEETPAASPSAEVKRDDNEEVPEPTPQQIKLVTETENPESPQLRSGSESPQSRSQVESTSKVAGSESKRKAGQSKSGKTEPKPRKLGSRSPKGDPKRLGTEQKPREPGEPKATSSDDPGKSRGPKLLGSTKTQLLVKGLKKHNAYMVSYYNQILQNVMQPIQAWFDYSSLPDKPHFISARAHMV